jgi:predicted small metal-binding protein
MAEINRQDNQDMRVRCSDLGHTGCNWEARGSNENEVMNKVEQHGREAHNESITDKLKEKVREVIGRRAA